MDVSAQKTIAAFRFPERPRLCHEQMSRVKKTTPPPPPVILSRSAPDIAHNGMPTALLPAACPELLRRSCRNSRTPLLESVAEQHRSTREAAGHLSTST